VDEEDDVEEEEEAGFNTFSTGPCTGTGGTGNDSGDEEAAVDKGDADGKTLKII
jgi:hypothetical protein